MDFGVTGKLGGYYLAEQYRKNAAAGKRRRPTGLYCGSTRYASYRQYWNGRDAVVPFLFAIILLTLQRF